MGIAKNLLTPALSSTVEGYLAMGRENWLYFHPIET
jgi:hypothetical protein